MITCTDGCGASVASPAEAETASWTLFNFAPRYRCPECYLALRAAAAQVGTSLETPDLLPPDSIGALRKPTAGTILPPSVNSNPNQE